MADEYTKGGDPIFRHEVREREFTSPVIDMEVREAVENHLRAFLGENSTVYHEIISELVHLDVYVFQPSPERPFITLVTSGMSDLPMNVPAEAQDIARAELVMCLPANWPLGQTSGELGTQSFQEDGDWPIHLMKFLARLPHEYETFLAFTHTIPHGNPPEPMADTQFTGSMIGPVWTLPESFSQVKVGEKSVWFYGVYPLYEEEMQFKVSTHEGGLALLQRFQERGINELLNVVRVNVAERKPFWKRWSK